MADPLYLSIWFPNFDESEMMHRMMSVLKQFPFSGTRPGIEYVSVHPVSWAEPTVLERRFRPGLDPEQAVAMVGDLLHEDYAYAFECQWDLWNPADENDEAGTPWHRGPRLAKFIAHGTAFDEGTFQQAGHIQVDFGLDTPFLYEDMDLSEMEEVRVRSNVQKLVSFTTNVERNCGISGRVLWSESEENLAQKLIARVQKVQ